MPVGTPSEVLEKVYEQTQSNGISEDYHVLLTMGNDTTATFKCFNSPYTQEEYDKLELLIKEIQKWKKIRTSLFLILIYYCVIISASANVLSNGYLQKQPKSI